MPLDDREQALLDVFCHCYEKLLDHLDALDDATQARHDWDAYRVVKECVNRAAKAFGSFLPESSDLSTLCDDFLRRIGGSIVTELTSSPVAEVFAEYQAAVQASPVAPQVDLTHWQRLGEELSRECYQAILSADSPNLTRVVKPVSIELSRREDMSCLPRKAAEESEITFHFAPYQFTLQSYVNLPFYFFHEYLSHLHTARLFAESDPCPTPFEDGWLLYLAHEIYCHRLLNDPHPALAHHLHCEHYVGRYCQEQNDDASKEPWVRLGYEQARRFEAVVRPDLFRDVTLLVAISPYDHFAPDIPDLHGEFVRRVKRWLDKTATLPAEQKEDKVKRLTREIQTSEAIRRLFEFLIED